MVPAVLRYWLPRALQNGARPENGGLQTETNRFLLVLYWRTLLSRETATSRCPIEFRAGIISQRNTRIRA